MDTWNLLIEIVVLLTACLIFGALFSRMRQSPLVGYLLAGMIVGGPGSLHMVRAEQDIEAIAELGVSLLLFSLGLEFSWQKIRNLDRKLLAGGWYQVVFTCVGTAVAVWFFRPFWKEAIAIGCMVSLSSTACVLRVLMDQGEIDSVHGRNSVAVLLVQDLAVIPFTLLLTLLAGSGTSTEMMLKAGEILILAAFLIALLYLTLNLGAVKILGSLTLEKNRELSLLLAISVGLGSTWLAHAAGLSPALGAFVAGMFLGGTPFAAQIRSDVSGFRVVLLTLFFGSAGMIADPIWILKNWAMVLGVSVLILFGKTLIVWLIFCLLRISSSIALATGLCLAQVGEFAFVLGAIGKEGGLIEESTYQLIVSSAIVTLLLTPYLVSYAPRLGLWFGTFRKRQSAFSENKTANNLASSPGVIIIGFGPAGKAVGRALLETGQSVLVLDLNEKAKQEAEWMGLTGQIGDARHIEILLHAQVQKATVIVITLPGRSDAMTVLEHVRAIAPHAFVVVRSRYQLHRHEFEVAGAHAIIGDEEEVGQKLSEQVLSRLGSRQEIDSP